MEERKCFNCGDSEEEMGSLHEAESAFGFGLLFCDFCCSVCDICGKLFDNWSLKEIDGGETYGKINVCMDCAKEIKNEPPKNTH